MNFNTRERCNNVFRTCCALHNWLLDFAGKTENRSWQSMGEWDRGNQWEVGQQGVFGEFGAEELNFFDRFRRRVFAHVRATTDDSGVGFAGAPAFWLSEERSWYELQRDLVHHFTNRYAANAVMWV
jgi:hypothetical protein